MEKEVLNNDVFHFEHQHWRRQLLFWEDELKFFENRLSELVGRWTKKDVLAQLEHFQNQFILHKEVIDTLQHDINVHETDMSEHSKKGKSEVLNTNFTKHHVGFRDRIETQRTIYHALKKGVF
ncbi:hypothetical protein ACJRPK_06410 [Aquimarina sp. 2-A2]|uniref:hypothetical protein n=1 Tax=Aquimarina sp. 2-A2 TaxID=3382644 RepID=UPI00387F22E4